MPQGAGGPNWRGRGGGTGGLREGTGEGSGNANIHTCVGATHEGRPFAWGGPKADISKEGCMSLALWISQMRTRTD